MQDGLYGNVCPQGNVKWLTGPAATLPAGPDESEDCLFLDVVMPSSLFKPNSSGAPVIVWIHGGGYLLSSKWGNGDASGLIANSISAGREGFIWVAINYRLGPLGFLAGPTMQANGGVANAGLYDQLAALRWVKQYIHLFGGDPNRVTMAGASAGAGSIMHHLTAYGGAPIAPEDVLYQQVLIQSPAIQPITSHFHQDQGLQLLLNYANVSSFAALKSLDAPTMLRAQKLAQVNAFFGQFIYGPATDGTYVTDIPGKLMLQGAFNPNVTVLSGHNTFEAVRSTDPFVTTAGFNSYIQGFYPSTQPPVLSYISNTLYPPVYDGSQPYTTPFARLDLAVTEANFACNTNFLARAYKDKTYGYLFSVPPGEHQQDLPYTFFPNTKPAVANVSLALTLQDIIINYVQTGNPNSPSVPTFPIYGNGTLLNLNQSFINTVPDNVANERCIFWQKALYE